MLELLKKINSDEKHEPSSPRWISTFLVASAIVCVLIGCAFAIYKNTTGTSFMQWVIGTLVLGSGVTAGVSQAKSGFVLGQEAKSGIALGGVAIPQTPNPSPIQSTAPSLTLVPPERTPDPTNGAASVALPPHTPTQLKRSTLLVFSERVEKITKARSLVGDVQNIPREKKVFLPELKGKLQVKLAAWFDKYGPIE